MFYSDLWFGIATKSDGNYYQHCFPWKAVYDTSESLNHILVS